MMTNRFLLFKYIFRKLQGDRMQTVKSNLSLTDRKNTINVNLMVDSVQGRLGIYAWMITVVCDPQLASIDLGGLLFPKK